MSKIWLFFVKIKKGARTLFKVVPYLTKFERCLIIFLGLVIFFSLILWIRESFFIKKTKIPAVGGNYTEGTKGEVRFFMPILKQTEAEKDINKLVFSSLVKFNQKGEVIPDLAERWEAIDGKSYKFYLRKAFWHDGKPFSSDDVIFTFNLIQKEELHSPFFELLKGIQINKIDQSTILFILPKPSAVFITSLDIPILPKHLLENILPLNLSSCQFAKAPIGTGPFKFKKIIKEEKLTKVILVRNENYFKEGPYLAKFILKVYAGNELSDAYRQRKFNGFVGRKPEKRNIKIILPRLVGVFFNLQNTDKNLRRALALSTNRDELLKEVEGEKVYYPILPGFLGYKEAEKNDFNPEKAKEYFSKATPPQKLVLLTKSTNEEKKIAEILKKQWEQLPIEIEIKNENDLSFETALKERNFNLLLVSLDFKTDPDPSPFWHSSFIENGYNFAGFKNKEVDKLLEDARIEQNLDIRRLKYEKFIDIIQSEIPAIFLYRPIYYYNINPIIKGVEDLQTPSLSDRFWNVESWYIKTKLKAID